MSQMGQKETKNHVRRHGRARGGLPHLARAVFVAIFGNAAMAASGESQTQPAQTLGNMRANGMRSLDVSCWQCHHRMIMSVDQWPDVPVPSFGPRMVCTRCGIIGADVRPNPSERR
jgi:hypothetical protein